MMKQIHCCKTFCLWETNTKHGMQRDEFAVAVLEKVAKLEDEEEVTGLMEVAQGRRAFGRF